MLLLRTLCASSQILPSFWITLVTFWGAGYLMHPGFISDLVRFVVNSFLLQSFLEGRYESGSKVVKSAVKYINICSGATIEMKFTVRSRFCVEGSGALADSEELFQVDCNVCGCCCWESEFYKCIVIILYVAERRDVICNLLLFFLWFLV